MRCGFLISERHWTATITYSTAELILLLLIIDMYCMFIMYNWKHFRLIFSKLFYFTDIEMETWKRQIAWPRPQSQEMVELLRVSQRSISYCCTLDGSALFAELREWTGLICSFPQVKHSNLCNIEMWGLPPSRERKGRSKRNPNILPKLPNSNRTFFFHFLLCVFTGCSQFLW